MNVLWEEELNFLVGKLAQLGAENIVDADLFCIATVMAQVSGGRGVVWPCSIASREGGLERDATVAFGGEQVERIWMSEYSRQVGDGKRRIVVEVIRL